jgi:transcription antitermination protein NusB
MGKRREGREAAVQYLYQLDLNGRELTIPPAQFWDLRSGPNIPKTPPKIRIFAEQLIAGVTAHLDEIDEHIKKHAANYQLHRIAAVDRNILRVAIYEILFSEDVPPAVSINEAIEIAKRFGSEDSGRFVNGLLDRIRGEVNRPARDAAWRPREKDGAPERPAPSGPAPSA